MTKEIISLRIKSLIREQRCFSKLIKEVENDSDQFQFKHSLF